VEKLSEMGAKIELVDARFNTPLLLAVHEQNAKMVEILIELGANPEQTYSISNSAPLAYAVMLEDRATMSVLLESNVNVNAIDRNGLSILTLAVTTGNSEVVTQVAEAGGQFQGKIDGRWSPVEFAKAIGNEPFVELVASYR
jgi:ankyrin repeat protein